MGANLEGCSFAIDATIANAATLITYMLAHIKTIWLIGDRADLSGNDS